MLHELINIEAARQKLLAEVNVNNFSTEVSLQKALMRINYKSIVSDIDLPSTTNSAVDGYGISSQTFFDNQKIKFRVAGAAKAGHPFKGIIGFGEAIEIYTGAIVPEGVDTVIMHEKCKRVGNKVLVRGEVKKLQNIRPIGENLWKGETIVKKGKLINSADIGQLAAAGNSKVKVFKRLSVSIISTGDELINSKTKTKSVGQIFDSNKPMLLSLLNINYLKISDLGIVKDNRAELAKKYEEALSKSDVVISSGGASDGIEDHTQNALRDIGAECLVWQLAMKPGKPMAIGRLGEKFIFCLPGNPVAAFVCTKLLINPILLKLGGSLDWDHLTIFLKSDFDHIKNKERAEFLRAKIINNGNQSFVNLFGKKGAGVISSLTGADGIVEIPKEIEKVSKGDMLKFYPFNHRGL